QLLFACEVAGRRISEIGVCRGAQACDSWFIAAVLRCRARSSPRIRSRMYQSSHVGHVILATTGRSIVDLIAPRFVEAKLRRDPQYGIHCVAKRTDRVIATHTLAARAVFHGAVRSDFLCARLVRLI